jgi:hypothetical protein
MEFSEFNIIENKIFSLKYEGLSISEFEQWVYDTSELQTFLSPEDYFLLISLNFKSKHIEIEIDDIIEKYIDYGKFETIKVLTLLKKALKKEQNTGEILRQFYDMYCTGYYFFEDLGLGYGLACETPLKYANTWEELSEEQKCNLINSFYPQLESDLRRALDWIENKKIVLTGFKNDIDHWEFIDNRTPDESISTVWHREESKQEKQTKHDKKDMKRQRKWWKLWRKGQ